MNELTLFIFFILLIIISLSIIAVAVIRMRQTFNANETHKRVMKLQKKNQPWVTVLVRNTGSVADTLQTVRSVLKNKYHYFDIVIIDEGTASQVAAGLKDFIAKRRSKKIVITLLQRRKKGTIHESYQAGYRKSKKGTFVITLDSGVTVSTDFIKRSVVSSHKRGYWNVPASETSSGVNGDTRQNYDSLEKSIAGLSRIFWHTTYKAEVFTARYLMKTDLLNKIDIKTPVAIISIVCITSVICVIGVAQQDFSMLWYAWLLFMLYLVSMIWLDTSPGIVNKLKLTFASPSAFLLLPVSSCIQAVFQLAKRK